MSKRRGSGVARYVEYLAARIWAAVIRSLPMPVGFWLGRRLGDLLFIIDKRHRLVAYDNLAKAYGPSLSPAQVRSITKGVFRHLAVCGVEMLCYRRLERKGVMKRQVKVNNARHIETAVGAGKGCIFVTAHLGNWELLGCVMGEMGYPLLTIARPLDNPLLDRFMLDLRTQTGQRIVPRRGSMQSLIEVLRRKQYLAFLLDQDARRHGVFVPFFGRMASTAKTAATLALKTGAPIVTGFCIRVGKGINYSIEATPPIWPERTGRLAADIERLTTEVTSRIEAYVRRNPEQWLWIHRRWKTEPNMRGAVSPVSETPNQET